MIFHSIVIFTLIIRLVESLLEISPLRMCGFYTIIFRDISVYNGDEKYFGYLRLCNEEKF